MQNTFYLCEKQSQARTLAKLLGADTKVEGVYIGQNVAVGYAYGHLLNLAMPDAYVGDRKWTIESLPILPQQWLWTVPEKHREHYAIIGKWLEWADAVVIATDPDDEGEVIGRQILISHGYTGQVSRLWASALDKSSLERALVNLLPLEATENIYQAGKVRRELDWLYGINFSRAYSVKFDKTTHIGRIKTRLLAEIVKRDREVESFSPSTQKSVRIALDDTQPVWQVGLGTTNYDRSFTSMVGMVATCLSCETTDELLPPPLPYTLSALLAQAADDGIPLATGYAEVQDLYESGCISYPRTSSTELPKVGGSGFAAHHAIINIRNECPEWMSDYAKQIFNMIHLNGVMQDIGPATIKVRRLTCDFGGEVFESTERWVEPDSAGWLHCDPKHFNEMVNNRKSHVYQPGEKVSAKLIMEDKPIAAPRNYTESSLLRKMAESGIGTEATRVDAISNLFKDRVAIAANPDEKASSRSLELRSTDAGKRLLDQLPDAVKGSAMEDQVKKAVHAVRNGKNRGTTFLLDATKWIARTIYAPA